MNLLLDTHVLLWWLNDDPQLGLNAREAIADGQNLVFLSAVSIWEVKIKQAIGKLELSDNFEEVLKHQPFIDLDITFTHAHAVGNLPMHHRDPFDRMLITQAIIEKMTLVTKDALFEQYDIPIIRA